MDGRGCEVNEGGIISGYAGADPKIGHLIEIMTAPAAGLPLRLKAVVRNHTNDHFGVEFVAETPDEKRYLRLLRQFLLAAVGHTDA